MKKLIQISLIVLLVCVVFQVMASGTMASANTTGSSTASGTYFTANTSAEDVQMAACLVHVRGVICLMPLVGWNT